MSKTILQLNLSTQLSASDGHLVIRAFRRFPDDHKVKPMVQKGVLGPRFVFLLEVEI